MCNLLTARLDKSPKTLTNRPHLPLPIIASGCVNPHWLGVLILIGYLTWSTSAPVLLCLHLRPGECRGRVTYCDFDCSPPGAREPGRGFYWLLVNDWFWGLGRGCPRHRNSLVGFYASCLDDVFRRFGFWIDRLAWSEGF